MTVSSPWAGRVRTSPSPASRPRAWSSSTANVRCREGEIDIIARDGATIVFVEVKTRRTMRQGSPLEAITPVKPRRIRMLGTVAREQAEFYPATRIDAIGIVMSPRPTVTHVRNVQVDA